MSNNLTKILAILAIGALAACSQRAAEPIPVPKGAGGVYGVMLPSGEQVNWNADGARQSGSGFRGSFLDVAQEYGFYATDAAGHQVIAVTGFSVPVKQPPCKSTATELCLAFSALPARRKSADSVEAHIWTADGTEWRAKWVRVKP